MENAESVTEIKIFNAAYNVFMLFGYHGTTHQKIANKAGVNKSAIHYYFRSKDKLYVKIVKKVLDILFDTSNISNQNENGEQKLFLITELHTNTNLFTRALMDLYPSNWEDWLIRIKEKIT